MTKVFLSYDRDDRASARKIADALQRTGHSVWWDRNIRGGAEFSQEIDLALQAAEAVVVLWSERSITSPWVRDEAGVGRDSGRLVPVRLDDCTPPLGFRQYQTIDLRGAGDGDTAALEELDEAIAVLGPAEAAARPGAGAAKKSRQTVSRRRLLAGTGATAAVAAAGGGILLYRRAKRREPPPEVVPLMDQAKQLMNQNTREGQYQAIGLYQRVTQMAPNYADGWGWLGYTYGVVSHFHERQESLALRARANAAARHALELDSNCAFGELALSVALPLVGYWAERERLLLRASALDPDNDEIMVMRAVALIFAGRSTEAVPFLARVKRRRPLAPAEYNNYLIALWSAGQLAELDQAINDAASLYPTQSSIWFTRVGIAMYNGQFNALRMLIEDEQSRPSGIPDAALSRFLTAAHAIETRSAADIDKAMAEQIADAHQSAVQAEVAIRNASALGRIDDAFAITNAYYFGRGFIIPDYPTKGSSFSPDQRQTRFLFQPATKPMRSDARFEVLVKELGFDRYWRESGEPPDYRHIPGL